MPKLLVSDVVNIETSDASTKPVVQKWFVLPGPPKEWTFAFVDDEELVKAVGVQCYAYTDIESALVLFGNSLKSPKRRETLRVVFVHELFHVGLGTDGSVYTIQQALGTRNADVAAQREEALAGILSNNLAASLFASGLMKLPKIPK